MIRKTIKAIIVASSITVVPVIGNINMFYSPQIWILFTIGILASIFQPRYNIVKDKSKSKDKGTEIQIIWSVYITQLFVVLEATYFRFPESLKWNTSTTFSLVAMILGLVLRTWAIYTLGRCFTMHLSIQKDHQIIRRGPYKYIRHPSYAGAFLTYVGAPIFLHAWFSLIVAAIILPIAWLRRIHYEEKLLIGEFGEEYKSYCKSVKKAIPGLW